MKLLFVSNLFPDASDPVRGLDNACLLHHLAEGVGEIRVVALRPTLRPGAVFRCRDEDRALRPVFLPVPYVPRVGSRWNHRLMAFQLGRTLARLRSEFSFDAVLGSWLYPDGCALARLAPRMGFPYWLICQGSDAHRYLDMPVRRRLIVEACSQSRAVVTRSADLARRLREAGVPQDRLHPVYNGVDTALFHPVADRGAACRELGLDPAAEHLLFVGNFLPVKNPRLLVEAWAAARARRADRDLRLVMIGTGPLEQEVRELARSLGVEGALVIAGRQAPASVGAYFRACRALVMASWNEGVPNVILEAFASGVPVVATDVGGISEVVNAPHLGRLVPAGDRAALADAIAGILETPADARRIAEHGAGFSWASTARRYLGLLQATGPA